MIESTQLGLYIPHMGLVQYWYFKGTDYSQILAHLIISPLELGHDIVIYQTKRWGHDGGRLIYNV